MFETPLQDILSFAEKAVSNVKVSFPEAMTEFIMRVDMFEKGGKLKVNEIESFDANFQIDYFPRSSSNNKRKRESESWNDEKSYMFFINFWKDKINCLLASASSS